jgi:hypothetical protein
MILKEFHALNIYINNMLVQLTSQESRSAARTAAVKCAVGCENEARENCVRPVDYWW